jgi:hypothetical protein
MVDDSRQPSRRDFLTAAGSTMLATGAPAGLWTAGTGSAEAQTSAPANGRTKEEWLDLMMQRKALSEPLHMSRFVERIYFLTKPIGWKPNPDQGNFQPVEVPAGFITDFTSIPRPFWALLPPDGEYTYAAIVHDYLYWTQTRPRDVADQILKFGMQDLRVDSLTVETIYTAVRVGGGGAWDGNAELKKQGEKRFLARYPENPTIRWQDWKKLPGVFKD